MTLREAPHLIDKASQNRKHVTAIRYGMPKHDVSTLNSAAKARD
jgi:hypothetical protein